MNKLAVVTGASSGIGLEFAKLLAADKYDLVIASRDKEALDTVGLLLKEKYGIKVSVVPVDLSLENSADALWSGLANRKPDVLINNAGFGDLADVVDADYLKLQSMISLNITSLTRLSQLAAISMKRRGSGNIVNVGSILSFFPSPHSAVYGASKAYVLQFSEALSEELRDTGVYVTALCPGPTQTGFAKVAHMERSRAMRGHLPSAEDVARYGYASMKENKVVAVHGFRTRLNALIVPRLLSRSMMRKIISKIQTS